MTTLPPAGAAGRRPSLAGLVRVHRSDGSSHSRQARVLLVVCLLLVAAAVVLVALVPDLSTTFLLGPVGLAGLQVVRWMEIRRSWTALEDEGVRVSRGLERGSMYRWEDVGTVGVPGRWTDRSSLRLHDGREVLLPHLPAAVAEQLRDRLDVVAGRPPAGRATSAPVAPDVPRPDDDLEGPFRRGPLRR